MDKKKENPKKIVLEVGKEYFNPKTYVVPKTMEVWKNTEDMTQEYKDMLAELITCTRYIVSRLNEGPEVNMSIVKRTATLKVVLTDLILYTMIDGYHRFGVLTEVLNDILMRINLPIHMQRLLISKSIQQEKNNEEKIESYVT